MSGDIFGMRDVVACSKAEAEALDNICTQSARAHFQFGLEDSRVVGIFPFHWAGGTRNMNGSISGSTGIINLPRCASTCAYSSMPAHF